MNKRDPFLMKSILGGLPKGGFPKKRKWVNPTRKTLVIENIFDDKQMRTKYAKYMNLYHNIQ